VKNAQNVAQPVLFKICFKLLPWKKEAKLCLILQKKTAQSKQAPNMRKFAESGHPDADRRKCFS
jgi:hypothetical protein